MVAPGDTAAHSGLPGMVASRRTSVPHKPVIVVAIALQLSCAVVRLFRALLLQRAAHLGMFR